MQTTLGIDLGTSGVRAIVLGTRAEQASVRLDPGARRDPAALLGAVAEALSGLDLSQVSAMAVDGTSGTLLPIAADGSPVGRLSLYNDPAPEPQRAAVAACAPASSAAGGAISALARAIALQPAPDVSRILHEADWIAAQFCGRFDVTDENNALKTGYDPVLRVWPNWIKATGMDLRKLPDVLPPGAGAGQVTKAAAQRFGLPPNTVVVAGTTDGCASFLATGAAQPGDGVTALGSTTTLKLLSDAPLFAPDYGIYSHRLLGHWLPGGASNAGGSVLARFFTPEQLTAVSARIDPAGPSPCDFYPLLGPGERFPINDPALAPRLTPRPDDDAVFLHGLLEGIARIEALGYRRLAELGAPPVRRVLTVGGGAASPTWTAIRTRILGVPVEPAVATEAAHGAAILARMSHQSPDLSGPVLPVSLNRSST
jgi:sugar (pentulose or hexulose) kinase